MWTIEVRRVALVSSAFCLCLAARPAIAKFPNPPPANANVVWEGSGAPAATATTIRTIHPILIFWNSATNYQVTPMDNGQDLPSFLQTVVSSSYIDWLEEYNTYQSQVEGAPSLIIRGSFDPRLVGKGGEVFVDNGSTVDVPIWDYMIQDEITALINANSIPPPNSTIAYIVMMPPGISVAYDTQNPNGAAAYSCTDFCGYHSSYQLANGTYVAYAVIPDCNNVCTPSSLNLNAFQSTTWAVSHELAETITDPIQDPTKNIMGWYDGNNQAEIGDLCAADATNPATVTSSTGTKYTVQTLWSDAQKKCVSSAAPTKNYGQAFAFDTVTGDAAVLTFDSWGGLTTTLASMNKANSIVVAGSNFGGGGNPNADVMLYNPTTGGTTYYKVAANGTLTAQRFTAEMPKGYTAIVAGKFTNVGAYTSLFAYNKTTGAGDFYRLDQNLKLQVIKKNPNLPPWDIVIPGNFGTGGACTDIFFYNAGAVGALEEIDSTDCNGNLLKKSGNINNFPTGLSQGQIAAGSFRGGALWDLFTVQYQGAGANYSYGNFWENIPNNESPYFYNPWAAPGDKWGPWQMIVAGEFGANDMQGNLYVDQADTDLLSYDPVNYIVNLGTSDGMVNFTELTQVSSGTPDAPPAFPLGTPWKIIVNLRGPTVF
jgi:hypothetical protein